MVGEFPELQGLMGGYYARAEGLSDAVADAIRDHYKPVGQGDEVPTAPVTVAVALADKLDNLLGFFLADMPPTGSKDPFALRRAALAIVALTTTNGLRVALLDAIHHSALNYSHLFAIIKSAGLSVPEFPQYPKYLEVLAFFADRLKVQQKEAGVRHDLIDAVFALGGQDDLVGLLARVHALQAFIGTEDGTNLLAGYKRAANILKKEGFTQSGHPGLVPGQGYSGGGAEGSTGPEQVRADSAESIPLSYAPEPAEDALVSALAEAGPRAAAAVAAEDFGGAMAALATLRAPIDAFFEQVTVNDADPEKRTFRLSLLARLRDAVHGVADFSRIEG